LNDGNQMFVDFNEPWQNIEKYTFSKSEIQDILEIQQSFLVFDSNHS